jgi:hypothetical protein
VICPRSEEVVFTILEGVPTVSGRKAVEKLVSSAGFSDLPLNPTRQTPERILQSKSISDREVLLELENRYAATRTFESISAPSHILVEVCDQVGQGSLDYHTDVHGFCIMVDRIDAGKVYSAHAVQFLF